MKLNEQIEIKAVSIVNLNLAPRKKGSKAPSSGKRKRKSSVFATDKKAKVALRVSTPLTLPIAILLGVGDLLFEHDKPIPRDGYKRMSLDVDSFNSIHVKVQNREPDAVLDLIADSLDRFTAVDVKGAGPALQFDIRTTGYASSLADFVAAIDNGLFVMSCAPAQGALAFEASTSKSAPGSNVYAVT